jgi:hypothetical protein
LPTTDKTVIKNNASTQTDKFNAKNQQEFISMQAENCGKNNKQSEEVKLNVFYSHSDKIMLL